MPYALSLSFESDVARHRHTQWCAAAPAPLPVLPAARPERVLRLPVADLAPGLARCAPGRFFPARVLGARALPGPVFRVLDCAGESFGADFNAPAAAWRGTLDVQQADAPPALALPPARIIEWAGMEAPRPGQRTDFDDPDAMVRADETDDARFYASPRPVLHVDPACARRVTALYGELLAEGDRVLDLMCGWRSHLPAHAGSVTGLGMNAAEMAQNPALGARLVHDLNREPGLPFDDGAFDAVVNTVSIEYLVCPGAVLAEVGRVLRPGGIVAIALSTRCFPPKAHALWQRLHPAERLGWVLQLLADAGFERRHALVERGLARDPSDRYADRLAEMDPLLAAWGYRPG